MLVIKITEVKFKYFKIVIILGIIFDVYIHVRIYNINKLIDSIIL
jgi:hypothetical protein